MHHEQDIRKMGGLKKYLPITYWTALIGSLALIGFPGSAGFFSKDALIEAVKHSHWLGQGPIYWISYLSVLLGVFVTALYSFRMFFLVFHGKERMDDETKSHLRETPWVVTVPLILLAIPSAIIGWPTIEPVLFGDFFGDAIRVSPTHDVLARLGEEFHGSLEFLKHSFVAGPVFYLAFAGVVTAWFLYLKRPEIPGIIATKFSPIYKLLDNKYYFDDLWIKGFAGGGKRIGQFLWTRGDEQLIDGILVNGTAHSVGRLASTLRHLQTGYLYHYAFAMIIALTLFLGWLLWVY
jgi:NADH-quinone oxidoreductase subunit L